jgi:hypothetical protein
MASDLVTVRALKQLRPFGFQTGFKTRIAKSIAEIDRLIDEAFASRDPEAPLLVEAEKAVDLLLRIESTLEFEDPDYQWDFSDHAATLEYLSENCPDPERAGRVWLLTRRDRNLSRRRQGEDRFSNDPLSYQERAIIDGVAMDLPVLALVRENGADEQGWRGTPFWWPIIIPPASTPTMVFASKTRGEE